MLPFENYAIRILLKRGNERRTANGRTWFAVHRLPRGERKIIGIGLKRLFGPTNVSRCTIDAQTKSNSDLCATTTTYRAGGRAVDVVRERVDQVETWRSSRHRDQPCRAAVPCSTSSPNQCPMLQRSSPIDQCTPQTKLQRPVELVSEHISNGAVPID